MTLEDCKRDLMIEMFKRGALLCAQVSVFLNETGDCAIAQVYPRYDSDESFGGEFVVSDARTFDSEAVASFLGESLCGELTIH